MRNYLKITKQEIAIIFIGLAAFLGFSPLFKALNSNISAEIIGAAFSAIFILVVTKVLISHQSDIEHQSKKNEQVFLTRLDLYRKSHNSVVTILNSKKLSDHDLNTILGKFFELELVAPDNIIKSYQLIVKELTTLYAESNDNDTQANVDEGTPSLSVEVKSDDVKKLFQLLRDFANNVRKDLNLSGIEYTGAEKQEFEDAVLDTVAEVQDVMSFGPRQPLEGGIDEFFIVGNRNQDTQEARRAIGDVTKVIKEVCPGAEPESFKSMISFKEGGSVLINLSRVSKTSLSFSFPAKIKDGKREKLVKTLEKTSWEKFPTGVYLTFNFPLNYVEDDLVFLSNLLKEAYVL